MDRLRMARRPLRGSLTPTINEVNAELANTNPDKMELQIHLKKIEDVLKELEDFDMKIQNELLDRDATEAEYETESISIEDYRDKARIVKIKIETVLRPTVLPSPPNSSSWYDSPGASESRKRKTYKLPKIQLKKFNGELTEWLSWWSQFRKIHEDDDLHATDKFQYLIQCMIAGTRAKDLVESYPQTEENYPKVINALKDRFGKEKLLIQVYVRELLKMVINNAKAKEKVKLSSMFDKLESHLRALDSLKVPAEEMSRFLYPMVESSIPEEILVAWQRSSEYGKDGSNLNPPKSELDYLIDFLKHEVESEGQRSLARAGFEIVEELGHGSKEKKARVPREDIPTAASLYSGQGKEDCIFCGKPGHPSQGCFKANKMSLPEKQQQVRKRRCCYVCLKTGHMASDCSKDVSCKTCTGKHYLVMCPNNGTERPRNVKNTKPTPGETDGVDQGESSPEQTTSNANHIRENKVVLMKTLYVLVKGLNGKKKVRLLFDEGSQRSYIKTSTAKALGCKVLRQLTIQNSLFGGSMTEVRTKQCFRIIAEATKGKKAIDLELLNEDVICGSCPKIPEGPWLKELSDNNIHLTDAGMDAPDIEILIGSDLWGSLMTGSMVKLKCGLIAVETVFGWTVSGVIPHVSNYAGLVISMLTLEERSVPQLWALESIGIKGTAEQITQEEHDLAVKKKVQDGLTREEDGRYVVELPWVSDSVSIPSNKPVAIKRLKRATEKLKVQKESKAYGQIFKDWEQEGIVETVDVNVAEDGDHFLCHRPVFKPESLTTPVRPVFDASCKVGRNPSLNQLLEKGNNELEIIPSIVLRFREKAVGIIADIRKAFQMISVAKKDRNCQKFLWWEDEEMEILKVYRHCRVVFGMNCSPFILAAVLDYHLLHVPPEDKLIADILKQSLYVDNCVISVNSEDDYHEFRNASTRILADAKMELRQWEHNVTEPFGIGSNQECGLEGGDSLEQLTKTNTMVLGLVWNKTLDTLSCKVYEDNKDSRVVTKRKVLSSIARIFDPIGFTCPAILQPKIMLQDSWAKELTWDSEWDKEETSIFRKWSDQVQKLGKIRIPRIAFGTKGQVIQLHTFVDASQKAYAAVVFARIEQTEGVSVQLLLARSRLAPICKKGKKVTIPRLELLSCLIGSRLYKCVQESLTIKGIESYFWTDSSTALAWIRRDQEWGNFVGNRVKEIKGLTPVSAWRHVPGKLNPADLPSRGCDPQELSDSKWWEGPEWLTGPKESWPREGGVINEEDILEELKRTSVVTAASTEVQELRFSSYGKNVRVAGWIRRFLNNARKVKEERVNRVYLDVLQRKERRQGERDLIYQVQQQHFATHINLKGLQTEIRDRLLCIRTRLINRDDTEGFRYPIVLPNKDPLVEQLIKDVHTRHCHAGAQFVLGKLREQYWILQGRKAVNRVIHKCVICRRYSSKPMTCDAVALPAKRVQGSYAFETTGVDLAGPIHLKGGKKCWIVLYTCAVYRGLYLDIVDSISAEEFLDSLEKFTLTVGRPNTMMSDNGTNFVGAHNLMCKLDWKKLETKFNIKKIVWSFNPPTAAWWGGWWERLVRTVKELLRKIIGLAKLTRKDLERCLAAVAHVINHRPLTTLTEDSDDLTPLTPAMFMRDLPIAGLPERELIKGKDLQGAYKQVSELKEALKARFRKEYLSLLVQKRNEKNSHTPRIGDVVLVGSDNKKRYEWPLGRIQEMFPGKDGKTRVVKVKTSNGVFLRPVQRLYPLEVPSTEPVKISGIVKETLKKAAGAEIVEDQEILNNDDSSKSRSGREIRKPRRYGEWIY